MSHRKLNKYGSTMVIAVDRNYIPMLEVDRRHALTALATGRAQALDLKTWMKLGFTDVKERGALQIIVYPKAHAVSESSLGFGRGNSAILRRDDHVCQYQGCTRRATTVDHVVPRCQGGRSTWGNLVACCKPCNTRKGGRTPEEAGMVLKHPVRSPRYHLLEKFQRLVNAA